MWKRPEDVETGDVVVETEVVWVAAEVKVVEWIVNVLRDVVDLVVAEVANKGHQRWMTSITSPAWDELSSQMKTTCDVL